MHNIHVFGANMHQLENVYRCRESIFRMRESPPRAERADLDLQGHAVLLEEGAGGDNGIHAVGILDRGEFVIADPHVLPLLFLYLFKDSTKVIQSSRLEISNVYSLGATTPILPTLLSSPVRLFLTPKCTNVVLSYFITI